MFPGNIFKIVTMENTNNITNLTCKQTIFIIYNQQLFFDNNTKIELLINLIDKHQTLDHALVKQYRKLKTYCKFTTSDEIVNTSNAIIGQ